MMCKHHTFGIACRPRGIDDSSQIIRHDCRFSGLKKRRVGILFSKIDQIVQMLVFIMGFISKDPFDMGDFRKYMLYLPE